MADSRLTVRDIRTLPFLYVHRALLAILHSQGLPKASIGHALLAYVALAFYANESKCQKIGIRELAEQVGVSQDTMRRGLATLVEVNAVRVIPREKIKSGGKRWTMPNDYILTNLAAPKKNPI